MQKTKNKGIKTGHGFFAATATDSRGLATADIEHMLGQFCDANHLDGKRILAIIPDHTRTAPIDLIFAALMSQVKPRAGALDFIVALGTHPPLPAESIYRRVGIDREQHQRLYRDVSFYNHAWTDPDQLATIGEISAGEVEEISAGLMREPVRVSINKKVLDADVVLIIGPTFPHEVVGFSGGNKYLFPGIAGQEIIDMFHWLGALITVPAIIGVKHTPVRGIIDRAAAMLPVPRLCISLVVRNKNLAGIYMGSPEKAWQAAADQSETLHIKTVTHPYRTVLALAPRMYDELWVAAKCMYKLEPVVADQGKLIIYAPHLETLSQTHGSYIEKIGYHIRDYFLADMARYSDIPRGVLAHSTHVRGTGTFRAGIEYPRIRVTLASRIPRSLCEKLCLGYCDPDSIDPAEWARCENKDVLVVPDAGETLYRLEKE